MEELGPPLVYKIRPEYPLPLPRTCQIADRKLEGSQLRSTKRERNCVRKFYMESTDEIQVGLQASIALTPVTQLALRSRWKVPGHFGVGSGHLVGGTLFQDV
jgi:hypothetical protein